jgi:hypothetical protein
LHQSGAGELDGAEGVAWLLVVADEDRPALLQPGERALDKRVAGGVAQACGLVELLLADPADVRDGGDGLDRGVAGWSALSRQRRCWYWVGSGRSTTSASIVG